MRIHSVPLQCLAGLALLAGVCACTCPPAKNPTPKPASEAGGDASAAEVEDADAAAEPTPSGPAHGVEPTPAAGPPEGPPAAAESLPAQGQPCTDDRRCADGLSCLAYYGVAGRAGPEFHSCEIPCGKGQAGCPDGQRCATVADGPGQVCRPADPAAPGK